MLIKGKIALVTGGASGIGLACVEELLKNDIFGVTLADINEQSGINAACNFNSKYGEGKVIFVKTDIRDKVQFEGAFIKTIETFNHLDIVFNNAGLYDEVNYENCLDVNLKGTVHGLKLAMDKYLPKYKSGEDAIIINTASILGLTPLNAMEMYSVTKFGIIGLTRNYGCDYHYKRTGVKVVTICPAATDTPFVDMCFKSMIYREMVPILKEIGETKQQTPQQVAKCFIEIIGNEGNGSVWVIEEGRKSKIEFPELLKI